MDWVSCIVHRSWSTFSLTTIDKKVASSANGYRFEARYCFQHANKYKFYRKSSSLAARYANSSSLPISNRE